MTDPGNAPWARLKEVFAQVSRAPAGEREPVLDRLCGDDAALRTEVASLLGREPAGFLEPPVLPEAVEPAAPEIPGYRITGLLGRGGMGVVFEAEQSLPPRTVALKVLRRLPFLDDSLAHRFRREIEALARLEHPGIAVLHEAGESEEGWLWFSMERIRGLPLHRHVAEHRLPLRERVRVFRDVCDAMRYAHQHGVIHRDLKPSNILVTEEGVPKVLDFGLARLVRERDAKTGQESRPEAASVVSLDGHVLGTLPYMSPEQAEGRSGRVDVRSDVYSLGVILFELLTGGQPYELGTSTLLEAARIICERPARSPRLLNPAVPHELEAVVLRALEKDPERRYSSAAALHEDLERFLANRPVLARPPSTLYQLRKLVARHRVSSALLALLLVVIIGSAVVTGTQAMRIAGERDAALAARGAEEAVSDFLTGLFGKGDPFTWANGEPSVRELVRDGAERLETELVQQPLARARLSLVLGDVSRVLGEYEQARTLLTRAVGLRREELGADHADVEEAMRTLAELETYVGDHTTSCRIREECVAMALRRDGDPSVGLADAYQALGEGRFYAGEMEEARQAFQRAADLYRAVQPAETIALAATLNDLGASLQGLGRLDEAEELLRTTLEMKRRLGDEPLSIGWTLEALAHVANKRNDLEGAVALLREQVELYRANLHALHPSLAFAVQNLGSLTLRAEGAEAADPIVSEALRIREQGLGENHPAVADSLEFLATIRMTRGLPDDALELQQRAVETYRVALGEDTPRLGRALGKLGRMLHRVGALEESLEALEECQEILAAHADEPGVDPVPTIREVVAVLEELGDTRAAAEWRQRLP